MNCLVSFLSRSGGLFPGGCRWEVNGRFAGGCKLCTNTIKVLYKLLSVFLNGCYMASFFFLQEVLLHLFESK